MKGSRFRDDRKGRLNLGARKGGERSPGCGNTYTRSSIKNNNRDKVHAITRGGGSLNWKEGDEGKKKTNRPDSVPGSDTLRRRRRMKMGNYGPPQEEDVETTLVRERDRKSQVIQSVRPKITYNLKTKGARQT